MVTLTIDDDAYAKLALLAENCGVTAEEWLNQALARRPAEPPPSDGTQYDGSMMVGAIRSADDGPADLATDPKYMEGFGQSLERWLDEFASSHPPTDRPLDDSRESIYP